VTFLLDTNVVSETRRPRRLPKPVADWFDSVDANTMFVSVATLLEIEVGVRRLERRDPRRGAVLRRWKSQSLSPAFRGRVLPVDEEVADCCAALQVPDPRPLLASIIAATAMVHKLVLVTRNVSDFARMSVSLFNPWDATS
jgi:toxin FitB